MIDLTPELKAAGWKPISEIVNEPDDGIYYILEPRPHSAFYEPAQKVTKKDLLFYLQDYPNNKTFFRRLIPVTPDTIVLSREDAKYIYDLIYQYDLDLTDGEKATIEQLNADSKMLREVLRKSINSIGGSDGTNL